jgi:hypothetical protein
MLVAKKKFKGGAKKITNILENINLKLLSQIKIKIQRINSLVKLTQLFLCF